VDNFIAISDHLIVSDLRLASFRLDLIAFLLISNDDKRLNDGEKKPRS